MYVHTITLDSEFILELVSTIEIYHSPRLFLSDEFLFTFLFSPFPFYFILLYLSCLSARHLYCQEGTPSSVAVVEAHVLQQYDDEFVLRWIRTYYVIVCHAQNALLCFGSNWFGVRKLLKHEPY